MMSRDWLHKLHYVKVAIRIACCSLFLYNSPVFVYAGPEGGNISGGTGSISQSGLNTTIHQTSQNMAIDWQSFNVKVDEHVQYIQPNTSSISLNRILSNTGSTIAGQIDANGHVILVNANGVFFTPTSVLNVGSIIASGLDINTENFMNGDYIFNEILGTDGTVINSGTINASLGGNVALLGRSVENNGLISANLGSVNLAAGKQAILTFDNNGLLGVRVSQEILQNELGIDPAVLNNGEINATGGRVLLTGSVSHDVFSQAVNNDDMQARSVIVNADGTFTLGGGADVVNSGIINVSSTDTVGQIVLLGENVTSSGEIHADVINGKGGDIELHAKNTTALTQNSVTSARAETTDQGGVIKILGDKVGVFDQSVIDVSGANGGGHAYIGGDYQGKNVLVRNANRTTVAPDTVIYAEAISKGDGGQVIVWANEYTRYFGSLFARGGINSGDGGFVEVSGKQNLVFEGDMDLSATNGNSGMLLLDPKNITISSAATSNIFPSDYDLFSDIPSSDTVLNNNTLAVRLTTNNVTLSANNDIIFAADADVTSTQASGNNLLSNLTLQAGRSIILNDNVNIELTNANFTATVNATSADSANRDAGPAVFSMGTGSSIITNKQSDNLSNVGNITINTGTFAGAIGDFTLETLDSSVNGVVTTAIANGGNITVTNAGGNIILNNSVLSGGEGWNSAANQTGGNGGTVAFTANNGDITINSSGSINTRGGNSGADNNNGGNAGAVNLSAQTVDINGSISAIGGNGPNGNGDDGNGGTGGAVSVLATQDIFIDASVSTNGGNATSGTGNADGTGGNAGSLTISAGANLDLNAAISANGGSGPTDDGNGGAGGVVTLTAGNNFTANANISSQGGAAGGGSGLTGSNQTILVNGDGTDNTFTINNNISFTGLTVTFNGMGGNDQLVRGGAGATNTNWTIYDFDAAGTAADGADDGTFEFGTNTGSNALRFVDIENLVGSSVVDNFTINNGGSLTGLINGSAGSTDTLTINSTGIIVQLGDRTIVDATADTNLNVNNIETITANSGSINSNVILSDNIATTWTVTATNTGTIEPTSGATTENTTQFINFGQLTGGSEIDTFNINANYDGSIHGGANNDLINVAADVSGLIDGGANSDTLTITAAGDRTIQISNVDTTTDFTVYQVENIDATGTTLNTNGNALIATNSVNDWTINATPFLTSGGINIYFNGFSTLTGGTDVDTFDISVDFLGNINGGDNNDFFNITASSVSVTNIDGGAGDDTLTGHNSDNLWTINTGNGGFINNGIGTINYSTVENLNGGSAVDTFTFTASGALTGLINGGTGADRLNITALGANTVNIYDVQPSQPNNAAGNLSIFQIEAITANGLVSNTLQAPDAAVNDWNIESVTDFVTSTPTSGANSGRLVFGATTVTFVDFNHLIGGTQDDNFYFSLAGSITGSGAIVDGNTGTNTLNARLGVNNSWSFTSTTSGSLDQTSAPAGTYVSSFINIQNFVGGGGSEWANFSSVGGPVDINVNSYTGFTGVIGNGTNSTLTGINGQTNTWDIYNLADLPAAATAGSGTLDGSNDGIVNRNQADELLFIDFANLTGGDQNDIFTIQPTGNVTGLLSGGGGTTNTLNIQNSTISRVEIGTTGTPANLNVSGFNTITGNGVTILVSDSSITNNWIINGTNSGTLNGLIFNNFASLEGGVNNDTFNLDSITDFNGTINGGTGAGTDEIIASNRAVNNWVITNTSNTGTVTGLTGGFSNIETLTGNVQQDIFSMHDSFDFIGSINGGGGTNDELRAGNRVTNSWVITGANNTGTVTGLSGNFSNIETLTGNAQQDIFTLHNTIDFAGSINGNGGSNDELRAGNRVSNTWTVTAANNTGTVTGLTGNFSAIETLTGNAQRDVFNLHNSIDFDGSINGAGGTNDEVIGGDRLNNIWSITGINNTGNVTGLTGTFSNIEQLTGNTGQDNFSLNAGVDFTGDIDGAGGSSNTLTAAAQPNNWTITGLDSGTVTGLGAGNIFSNIQNLNGSTGDDTFTFQNGASLTGLISGGSQTSEDIVDMSALTTDISVRIGVGQNIYGIERVIGNNDGIGTDPESTLIGENNVNNWIITNTNTGSVDGINFENFNNLIGNTSDDIFTFSAAGNITGIIDGGAPNNADWTPNGTWTPWTLGQPADIVYMNNVSNVDVQIGQDIINIELIVGSDTNNGTLRFDSGTNNSNITGVNTGIVNGTEFRQFSELIGNTGSDTFEVSAGGNISTIRGGSGNDNFVVQTGGIVTNIYGEDDNDSFDILGSVAFFDGGNGNDSIIFRDPNINFTVGDDLSGFEGVIAVNGGTINARNNTTTTWDINGENSGNVSDTGITGPNSAPAENLTFSGFTTIIGGNGADIFNITNNGSVDGLVGGNGGIDTLNIDLSSRTMPLGQINYDGGGDAGDTVTITGTANLYSETYNPNQTIGTLGSFDQLRFTGTSVNFDANIRAVANVNDTIQVNTLTLSSTDPTNIFYLGTNSFGSANSLITTFDYANSSKDNIDVITLNGGDIQITGNVNIPGNLSITADNVTETAGSSITANTLLLLNTGTVGVSGNGLNTIINNLHVNNAGPVYLDEQDALVLTELNTSGSVNIIAGGNITSNASLVTSGALNLATTGNINLIGNNQLSSQLIFTGNDVVLNNNAATNLAGVSAANMTITSTGDITDSGTLLVSGTTTLTSSGDIILDETTNNFSTVNINDANTATLVDVDSISGGRIIADNINLQTSNGIGTNSNHLRTETANLTVNNQVSGGVYVDNNQAVTVSITNMGDIDYTNTSGNVVIERLYTNGGDYTLIDPSLPSPLYIGDVRLEVQNAGLINAYTGPGSHSVLDAPDIVAENLTVFSQGDFGNPARYMSIRVHNEFAFFGARGFVYYYGAEPNVTSGVADLFDFSSLASGIFNQQLVEVESLAEIDPAIFTEIRNYSYDDVSIKMPADQRYDDEEEQK